MLLAHLKQVDCHEVQARMGYGVKGLPVCTAADLGGGCWERERERERERVERTERRLDGPGVQGGVVCLSLMLPHPQDAALGQASFSKLGSFGAIIQVVLILYPSGIPVASAHQTCL